MELINALIFMLNEMSPYILLGFFVAGLMQAFVPQSTMSRHLSGTGLSAVVKAAALGVPLPLCSCGVLPTAIAMRRAGASKAASTSFLIATPQTGVDSIAATWSLLGPAFSILRPIAALVTALFGGIAVGKAEAKETASDGCCSSKRCSEESVDAESGSFGQRLERALKYGFVDLVGSIGGWLVTGLIIAALITVFVPADFFAAVSATPIVSMIAVLVIAVPMYVCATGSIPIALSLMLKGLTPGTAFVLLMAGPAANFASFTLLCREMGKKSAIIYLLSIIAGAIAFGLLIDYALPAQWFDLAAKQQALGCHKSFEIFPTICSAILVTLLVAAFIRNSRPKVIENQNNTTTTNMIKEYKVKGMNCPHCQASVTKSISGVNGVKQVSVDLSSGIAKVEGEQNDADVIEAVRNAGFDVEM